MPAEQDKTGTEQAVAAMRPLGTRGDGQMVGAPPLPEHTIPGGQGAHNMSPFIVEFTY